MEYQGSYCVFEFAIPSITELVSVTLPEASVAPGQFEVGKQYKIYWDDANAHRLSS
jgi:hypothetical protein